MKLMFRDTFRILRLREHLASEIAAGLLGLGIGVAVVVGQAVITESPYTVSGTGKVAIQGSASIIAAPDSLLASGRTALPKVVQPGDASK